MPQARFPSKTLQDLLGGLFVQPSKVDKPVPLPEKVGDPGFDATTLANRIDEPSVMDPPWMKIARAVNKGVNTATDLAKGLVIGEGTEPGQTVQNLGALIGAGIPIAAAMKGAKGLSTFGGVSFKGPEGFYSRVNRIAEGIPDQIHPDKLRALLKAGASQEEVVYRALPDFIASFGQKPINRKALIMHLEDNPAPELRVHRLNSDPRKSTTYEPMYPEVIEPQYETGYTLPGPRSEYEETLLELRPKSPWAKPSSNSDTTGESFSHPHFPIENYVNHTRSTVRRQKMMTPETMAASGYRVERDPRAEFWYNLLNTQGEVAGTTRANSVENATKHFLDDGAAKGNIGRMLEENQSDWASRGRELGYGPVKPEEYAALIARRKEWQRQQDDIRLRLANRLGHQNALTFDEMERMRNSPDMEDWMLIRDREDMLDEGDRIRQAELDHENRPPQMPFKDSWDELGLKQFLLDAARDPKTEWIGMTSGQQQINRYPGLENPEGKLRMYDERFAKKMQKLLGMHGGGKLEKIPARKSAPPTFEPHFEPYDDTYNVPGVDNQEILQVMDVDAMEPVASMLPGTSFDDFSDIERQITRQYDDAAERNKVFEWFARLTPEVKQSIREKGFPLMSAALMAGLWKEKRQSANAGGGNKGVK